ncbi:MAG: hypothetical protein AB1405_12770 [Bdellovibrionota bacterium]
MKKQIVSSVLSLAAFLIASSAWAGGNSAPPLSLVGTYDSGSGNGCEIISVQTSTRRAAVINTTEKAVDILDLSSPASPSRKARHALGLKAGEEVTSIAFHPSDDYYLVTVRAAGPKDAGRVEIRGGGDGNLLKTLETGVDPDAVAIDPTGKFAAVANEAEEFWFNKETREFESADGTLTLIRLASGAQGAEAVQIQFDQQTGEKGWTTVDHGRYFERDVDVNGNGKIDENVDLDGNGQIDEGKVVVGTLFYIPVKASEAKGEKKMMLPISNNLPAFLEPENVAFSTDGSRLYVSFQENNGIAVIDTAEAKPVKYFGLGLSAHSADTADDGKAEFSKKLNALREPDGIAVVDTPNGPVLITADEGDTEPGIPELKGTDVAGGSRTVGLFDARSGKIVGDTKGQIDQQVSEAGFYPDERSVKKGSEPEGIVAFNDGGLYAVVTLERANGIALVSFKEPENPTVVATAAIDKSAKPGAIAPEGIAYWKDAATGNQYVATANEKSGTVSVFQVNP